MKIIFTSAGRRVELIEAFKKAADKLKIDLTIYGADITTTAPALHFCDKKVIVPRITEENYIPFLIDYCAKEAIDALIPTIDTDLLLLAQNRDKFKNTKLILSNEDVITICRDKRKTVDCFIKAGVNSPVTVDDYTQYSLGYPAFIKPKNGSSSIFAYKVNDINELIDYTKIVPDYIVEPYVSGKEYTVDVLCDLKGNPIYITPRLRISTRSGEVSKTKIEQDDTIINETKKILDYLKPYGPVTIQLIKDSQTNRNFYIEINARFGGGAPITMDAGANSAEMILRLLNNEEISYQEKAAIDNVTYARYDQSIRVD